jgi:hypothetical protein
MIQTVGVGLAPPLRITRGGHVTHFLRGQYITQIASRTDKGSVFVFSSYTP